MFSFHRPKVYRSSTGCCICKAKSSSSRFTDSKKYEDDFISCFQLEEMRSGEICNACVLLVKRFKKLPPGSNRNWRHVVDARAGPGIKSLTKFKAKNKRKLKDKIEKIKKNHVYINIETIQEEENAVMNNDFTEAYTLTDCKTPSRSENISDDDDIGTSDKRLDLVPESQDVKENVCDFIDLSYYKREVICCGSIFKGLYGEVLIHSSFFKPCTNCLSRQQLPISSVSASPVHSPAHSDESTSSGSETNSKQSDSSDDSGYDDQDERKLAKNIQVEENMEMEKAVRCVELDKSNESLEVSNVTNQSLQSVSN